MTKIADSAMRFLLISVSGNVKPRPIKVNSVKELLSYLNYDGEESDLIISKRSLVGGKSHDKIQDREECPFVLCVYDSWIECP